MTTLSDTLDEIEVDYARFNAAKTLGTLEPSGFEVERVGGLVATRDRARGDAYYNRILGVDVANADHVDAAVDWIRAGTGAEKPIRIDIATGTDPFGEARDDLVRADTLVWLQHQSPSPLPAASPPTARRLTSDDRPALRELLTWHGEIADDVWDAKQHYLCTADFRWFGVFDGKKLVSAASIWVHPQAAIFGSGFTVPHARGQGHHQRLLELRLIEVDALDTVALVDVEPRSQSHRNCLRYGFTELETREVWQLADQGRR